MRPVVPDGTTCSMGADTLRCLATSDGTAGARCRADAPRCNEGLTCRGGWTCVRAAAGDPCDLGAIQTLCPESTRCLPTTVSSLGTAVATCAAPTPETEPSERSVTARGAVANSALYAASLSEDDREIARRGWRSGDGRCRQ